MASRRGGREGHEGDSNLKDLKQKARDGVYDLDLDKDSLVVQTKRCYEAAKVLKTEQKRIKKKRDQVTSKNLSKCMDKYDGSLIEIKDAVSIVNQTLEKVPRKIRKTESMREPGRSKQLSESYGGYSGGIEQLEDGQRTQRTQREATRDLERRIRLLEGEKEDLQQKLKNERTAKDDYLKRPDTHVTIDVYNDLKKEKDSLNQELMQMEDTVKRKQQEQDKNQDEIYRLKLKCQSLEEAKEREIKSFKKEIDKIRSEKKDISQQYEVEKNAKSDALTRLEEISVSVDSFGNIHKENDSLNAKLKRLQQESSDQISAQNATIQRLNQKIERLSNEREHYLQQCNAEKDEMNKNVSSLQRDLEKMRQERGHYKNEYNVEREEINRLNQKIERLSNEREHYLQQCNAEKDEMNKKVSSLQRDLEKMRQERGHYKNQCNVEREEINRLKQELEVKLHERNKLIEEWKAEQEEKEHALQRLKQEKDRITRERDNDRRKYDDEKVTYETNISSLQQEIERLCHEREYNRQQLENEIWAKDSAIKRLKEENRHVTHERDNARRLYKAEKEAKDDAVNRLSLMASSKLRDNNPNITDLSDQNRPTKIAEKLSELYDNQWTDAFDALENKDKNEREILDILLESLMIAYEECSKLANDNYLEKVQRAIECRERGPNSSPYKIVMSDHLKQEIKEFRKQQAPRVWKDIKEIVLPKIQLSNYHLQETDSYISFCIEISWLMAVQDPPLVLNKDTLDIFDTTRFKDYTKRGHFVEYVVWPALLLHESGPLLAKGVAQGCGKPLFTQTVGRFPSKDGDKKDERKQMASTFSGVGTGPQYSNSE